MSREDAYTAVQHCAMQALDTPVAADDLPFLHYLKADAEIAQYLNPHALAELFDESFYFRHVDEIFDRVFAGKRGGLKLLRHCVREAKQSRLD